MKPNPAAKVPLRVATATRIVGLHWKSQGSIPPEKRAPAPPAVLDAYRTVGSFYGHRSGAANKGKSPSPLKLAQLAAARANPRPSRQTRSKLKSLALSCLSGSHWTLHLPNAPKAPEIATAGAPHPLLDRSPYSFPFLSGPITLPNGHSPSLRLRLSRSGSLLHKISSPPGPKPKPATAGASAPSGWSPVPLSLLASLPPQTLALLDSWTSLSKPINPKPKNTPIKTRKPINAL